MEKILSDFANVRTGVVLSRKKAQINSDKTIKYNQLSLKCFEDGIRPNKEQIDTFISSQEIDKKYFTKKGDVVIRLRSPNRAIYIDKEDEGLLIHSLLAVIRVYDDKLDSKYLAYFINANIIAPILKPLRKVYTKYIMLLHFFVFSFGVGFIISIVSFSIK